MEKPKIGIIGFGFIGQAVAHGFGPVADIKIYDKYSNFYDSIDETVNDSDFIFIGVPTPTSNKGIQDLSNLEDAISEIQYVAKKRKYIIIKSTVLPGTAKNLASFYPKHRFISNPEFLTERTSKLDFINTARIIIGTRKKNKKDFKKIEELYRTRFTGTPIFHTTWEGAELLKYWCNAFFSLKVSFLNEMYDLSKGLGLNYNELRDMWLADFRVGNSHSLVPGPDGDRGYGGKCFPKDIKALNRFAKIAGYPLKTMEAADDVNESVRKNRDWEIIKGATSENNYGD